MYYDQIESEAMSEPNRRVFDCLVISTYDRVNDNYLDLWLKKEMILANIKLFRESRKQIAIANILDSQSGH